MEDLGAHCAWADSRVLSDDGLCAQLPREILEVIRDSNHAHYLDTIATAILIPQLTDNLFILYEPLIVDLAARWCHQTSAKDVQAGINVLGTFARILPAKPCLKLPLQEFIAKCGSGFIGSLADSSRLQLLTLDVGLLSSFLLALFRLYSHDLPTYSSIVSPVQLSSLLRHEEPSIRYLTIRCLALYMRLADAMVEKMISNHLPERGVVVQIDGNLITARLFSLWEEQRWRHLSEASVKAQLERIHCKITGTRSLTVDLLLPQTAVLAGILVPRQKGVPMAPSLALTRTTQRNLEKLARALLTSNGILLTGASGSGKTSLVTEAGKMLNKLPSMITLHLNEQTDAKSLLGVYTTSPTDGSFLWQPGVLARAMLHGRWVLIEGIHRAPPEVVGVVLSVIEHGEIFISSRNQRIRATTGFRVLATTTEPATKRGGVNARLQSTLNPRLWEIVEVEPLQPEEIELILSSDFPTLQPRVFSFLSVHRQVKNTFVQHVFRTSRTRSPDLRDLLKWCRRSQARLKAAGLLTGLEPVGENVLDEIFADAVTCYAGHISSTELHLAVTTCIAEVLQVPPQRMLHCIYDRLPSLRKEDHKMCVGRASVPIISPQVHATVRNNTKSKSAFALTKKVLNTLEEIATAVQYAEPILLVGETGIGKTAVIQHLATLVGQKLNVFNLSQQSESGDLLGGFKPITTRSLAIPMSETFDLLFDNTFSFRKNAQFQASIRKCISKGSWTRLIALWQEAVNMADVRLRSASGQPNVQANKRRRLESSKYVDLRQRWQEFASRLLHLNTQVLRGDKKFSMAFVEGKIVQALRNGEWVLLDEINLATPETLENIAELLYNPNERAPSLLLSESGEIEYIKGHRNFRIFAAMNPATDAGKRELPGGLRTRFTEIFIRTSGTDTEDLILLISTYLGTLLISDGKVASDLAGCYLEVQKMNDDKLLTDGAGQLPHFSLRSLVRALIYTNQHAKIYGLRRALYEGFLMSFATMLSTNSGETVGRLVKRCLLGELKNSRSLLNQNLKTVRIDEPHVVLRQHVVRTGSLTPEPQPHYIITPFVERNLLNLARAVSVRRFPILLQGPTSSGKTSMVEYLAKISGNEFVRINNHEHTDLQEYLGSYSSGEDGRFLYREGVLVEALRRGRWVVLDELNLAPTDVLEALNRLLDDNRELFIPETQETVRPHPNFVLFATQNPAGLYGGRKHLSRAFRNRFLELHFDDIPEDELEFILKERTQIAPSFCTRIITVYKRLAMLRQSSRLFEQRNSFATLRDLFRWASRQTDDREQLAINGFMLLAERVRDSSERTSVKRIIEEVMKVQIDEAQVYSARFPTALSVATSGVVWTPAMRRLVVLIIAALNNDEPVLLVGETGGGKTQICQTLAAMTGQHLHILNAHSNTETGDLIGAQRPVRNKAEIEQKLKATLQSVLAKRMNGATSLATLDELISQYERFHLAESGDPLDDEIKAGIAHCRSLFEWADGSLVVAMKQGEPFLLDEISLAEDSVLERLNSVLEPSRTILLAEKGPDDSLVRASPGFQFLATMNPGGDYGKKELSLALRNRLTEIWVSPLSEEMDILPILQSKIGPNFPSLPSVMIEFAQWFRRMFHALDTASVSLRKLLSWVDFVRIGSHQNSFVHIVHGAALVFIDSLGANPAAMTSVQATNLEQAQWACLEKLGALLHEDISPTFLEAPTTKIDKNRVQCGIFSIPCGSLDESHPTFVFDAPTTNKNAFRVVRALQLSRPILVEGDPGVGKTALVEAIAQAARRRLTRINLSEQTDLVDLFGSDVPVEHGSAGNFRWRDGPFLRAMQNGDWVLLDEMNLATQSVLEGLNSCLDHRKEVYVAELDRTFVRHPDFVLFATQNPHHQGGGRKGLPASFVNRFNVVYADALTEADLMVICQSRYKEVKQSVLTHIISAVSQCHNLIRSDRSFDSVGGPWEVNLRDIGRWLQLHGRYNGKVQPETFHNLLISQRFRTTHQRSAIQALYEKSTHETPNDSTFTNLSTSTYQLGVAVLERNKKFQPYRNQLHETPPHLLPFVQTLIHCVNEKWPAVLVGESESGMSTLIRNLAAMHGAKLLEFSVTGDIDATDLIGGYDQIHGDDGVSELISSLKQDCLSLLPEYLCEERVGKNLANVLELYRLCSGKNSDLELLQATCEPLLEILPANANYGSLLQQLLRRKAEVGDARFGWKDGMLVRAVEKGYWLLLDNANTCSSAVLDRLNSLLESEGKLIVSERHEIDGRPRIIQPHPNFRIFLTMDPRRGELSRAMRNRSIEIYIDTLDGNWSLSKSPAYLSESGIFNWRRLQNILLSPYDDALQAAVAAVSVDHLSIRDLSSVSPKEYEILAGQDGGPKKRELVYYNQLPELLFRCINDFHTDIFRFLPRLQAVVDDQPLHAESNELLIEMTGDIGIAIKATRIGWLLESFLALCRIREFLTDARINVTSLSVADMTVLERSMAAQKFPHSATNNVQPVAEFIDALVTAADEALMFLMVNSLDHEDWPAGKVNVVLTFLKDFMNQTNQRNLRPGILPIYIQIWEISFLESSETCPVNTKLIGRSLVNFGTNLKLSYGQSLSQLWSCWRPKCPTNRLGLDALLKLENIMKVFDGFYQKPLFVPEMIEIQSQLLAAKEAILRGSDDVAVLLGELERNASNLNPGQSLDDHATRTYFAADFETFCQYYDLEPVDDGSRQAHAALLAGRSTKYLPSQKESNRDAATLSRIASFAGWKNKDAKVASWKGAFAQDLLGKLERCRREPLESLDSLTEELSWLSKSLSQSTSYLSESQLSLLGNQLAGLICSVVWCHKDLLKHELQHSGSIASVDPRVFAVALMLPEDQDIFLEDVPSKDHFRHIWITYLRPALSLITSHVDSNNHRIIGASLVYFSLASLHLWIPDRPTDPALHLIVQRERYQRRKDDLDTRLQALRIFESAFSGQGTNLRIRRVKQEIELLGLSPPPPPVVRLEEMNLMQLHAEFSNILNAIIVKSPETVLLSCVEGPFEDMSIDASERSKQTDLLKQNIERMVQRLSQSPQGYRDLTVPVVQLLQMLDLGTTMLEWSERDSQQTELDQWITYVLDTSPFLGGSPAFLSSAEIEGTFRHGGNSSPAVIYLETTSLMAAICPWKISDFEMQAKILLSFESCYTEWKAHLRANQSAEVKKAKYYEYRDKDDHDDSEEFNEIFPTFDDGRSSNEKAEDVRKYDSRASTIRVANLHSRIFRSQQVASPLKCHILQRLNVIASLLSSSNVDHSLIPPVTMLPGLFLNLDTQSKFFQAVENSNENNIYAEPNVNEARKLLHLVRGIIARANTIKEMWPEHALPLEILACCNDILRSQISDPIAKLLMRAEKLHSVLGQWQAIASRQYSVAFLMDDMTTLIVSWRRLELSSWSRLLAQETFRCEENSKSWWFVVYEVAIFIPLRILSEGGDCARHAQDLVRTLVEFLQATNLGQFSYRLQVLEDFHKMTESLVRSGKCLGVISSALLNVIGHFERYEVTLQKTFTDGRAKLEQEVKEQIKLASWKDTTVTTLRESARRSHHKLFKIVKKYRALLVRPIENFDAAGPNHDRIELPNINSSHVTSNQSPFFDSLAVVEQYICGWADAPRRLREPQGAAASMLQIYKSSHNDLNIASELNEYVLSLTRTITELRSQTPLVADDENRPLVLHLKARKRRLLADVLKDVQHMGIRRNLSTQELEKQKSLSSILGSGFALSREGETLKGTNISRYLSNARHYFHGFLDLVDRTRKSLEEHSVDLSSSEVGRCVGSLEGFLLFMQQQRISLVGSLENLASLRRIQEIMSNLQSLGPSCYITLPDISTAQQEQIRFAVSWLPQLLDVACDVLNVQAKHDARPFAAVIECLKLYRSKFEAGKIEIDSFLKHELPALIQTEQLFAKFELMRSLLARLRKDLVAWIAGETGAAYLLTQLLPWTNWESFSISHVAAKVRSGVPFEVFQQALLAAIDKIFIGMQNYQDVARRVPHSMEDMRWLTSSNQELASCIDSFHMAEIAAEIINITSSLSRFDGMDFKKATSLCAVFTPIIQQFHVICEHSVERYADMHAETCRLAYALVKSFSVVASEGFCGPSDGSTNVEDNAAQVEEGTGLADGDGAEDISKDICDDEDLSEMAQQQRNEGKEEMGIEEHAVDMGGDDMQGEIDQHVEAIDDSNGDHASASEDRDDDLEDETGMVDSLDPTTVDEKLWEDIANDREKQLENNDGVGKSSKDQTAGQDRKDNETNGPEEIDDEDDEEAVEHGNEDTLPLSSEMADPHLKQEQPLELQDEVQLDGDQEPKEGSISDDGLDEFSDAEAETQREPLGEEHAEFEKGGREDQDIDTQSAATCTDGDTDLEGQAVEDEIMEDQGVPEDEESSEEDIHQIRSNMNDREKVAEDVGDAETGASGKIAEKENADKAGSSGKAPVTELPSISEEKQEALGSDRQGGTQEKGKNREGKDAEPTKNREAQAFKRLGDVLERWHRQQRDILQPSDGEKTQQADIDLADADFEHVENNEDLGDRQALGGATEDQATALDFRNAIEDSAKEFDDDAKALDVDHPQDGPQSGLEQVQPETKDVEKNPQPLENGGFIFGHRETTTLKAPFDDVYATNEVDDVDLQLSNVDLSTSELSAMISPEEAFRLWSHFSSLTHPLSLILTEQLRLILSPTQATKLRGDFRTGKRLNIKRVISYVASGYKRDKIWMRRSIPSKRNYQIMLAVDDSKSMTEGGAHALAFETLALLCKSLSMLEVGEICVVSFGSEDHIRVAHCFGDPFTAQSGPKIYQNFGFQQSGTNVRKLIQESISLFREARAKGPNSSAVDLWQLQLIISDGIYEDHEFVRRLVRQALEERIMIVFVIVDSNSVRGNSILDLTQAVFEPKDTTGGASGSGEGEIKLKMKRYLDGFPFPYYVVVREVGDLPGVLATALKGWLSEVMDAR